LLKTAGFLVAICLLAWFHFSTLSHHLERYERDLTTTNQDLKARRAGCSAALASAREFEKHVAGFLAERESRVSELETQIEQTRERIGNVTKIREECEKLESELAEVRKLLWLLPGQEGPR
jgi:predicted  nucleic acid-binding Zn-ribbon protein